MRLKVILNALDRHGSFVYDEVVWQGRARRAIDITVRPRRGSRPICSGCGKRRPTHDHLPSRHYQHVPFWGLGGRLVNASRRVNCSTRGVNVERIPWAHGKERTTRSFQWFLATWARRLSWQETARTFGSSWRTVRASAPMAVLWGLRHRDLTGIRAIGIDEVAVRKGHRYLTLVYPIDAEPMTASARHVLKRSPSGCSVPFRENGRKKTDLLGSDTATVERVPLWGLATTGRMRRSIVYFRSLEKTTSTH